MKRITLLAVLVFVLAGPAMADMNIAPPIGSLAIDFRTAAWAGADNQTTFAVGNVTATALPQGTKLYRAEAIDGLGIYGGEPDEIDRREQLRIDIGGGMLLNGVWLADIFSSPDGGDGEQGDVLITLTDTSNQQFDFAGYWPEGTNNGELWVPFGGTFNVTQLLFSSVNQDNDEYAVIGAAVPVPGAVLLGVLGLSAAGLRLRKRS